MRSTGNPLSPPRQYAPNLIMCERCKEEIADPNYILEDGVCHYCKIEEEYQNAYKTVDSEKTNFKGSRLE